MTMAVASGRSTPAGVISHGSPTALEPRVRSPSTRDGTVRAPVACKQGGPQEPRKHSLVVQAHTITHQQHNVERLRVAVEAWDSRLCVMRDRDERIDAALQDVEAQLHKEREAGARFARGCGLRRARPRVMQAYHAKLHTQQIALEDLRRTDDAQLEGMLHDKETVDAQRKQLTELRLRCAKLEDELSLLQAQLQATAARAVAVLDEHAAVRQHEHALHKASQRAVHIHQRRCRKIADAMLALQRDARAPESAGDADEPGSGDLTEEQEQAARARIIACDIQIREQEDAIRAIYSRTVRLRDVFRGMVRHGGLTSLRALEQWFVASEVHAYQTHGRVQHQIDEARAAEEATQAIQSSCRRLRCALNQQAYESTATLEQTRTRLRSVADATRQLQETEREYQRVLMRMSFAVSALYLRAGGSDTSHALAVAERVELSTPPAAVPATLFRVATAHDGTISWGPIVADDMMDALGAVEERLAELGTAFARCISHPCMRRAIRSRLPTSPLLSSRLNSAAWTDELLHQFIVARWPTIAHRQDRAQPRAADVQSCEVAVSSRKTTDT